MGWLAWPRNNNYADLLKLEEEGGRGVMCIVTFEAHAYMCECLHVHEYKRERMLLSLLLLGALCLKRWFYSTWVFALCSSKSSKSYLQLTGKFPEMLQKCLGFVAGWQSVTNKSAVTFLRSYFACISHLKKYFLHWFIYLKILRFFLSGILQVS